MEFIRFIFSSFWIFIGFFLLVTVSLDIICNTILNTVKVVCLSKMNKSEDSEEESDEEIVNLNS